MINSFLTNVRDNDIPVLHINELVQEANTVLGLSLEQFPETFRNTCLLTGSTDIDVEILMSDRRTRIIIPVSNPCLKYFERDDLVVIRKTLQGNDYESPMYDVLKRAVDLELVK